MRGEQLGSAGGGCSASRKGERVMPQSPGKAGALVPLGNRRQGRGGSCSPGLGGPAGMLLPPLPLGCLLSGACGAAVSLGGCAELPPAHPLARVGPELRPWQPTLSQELALPQGGWEEEEEEDEHGKPGRG